MNRRSLLLGLAVGSMPLAAQVVEVIPAKIEDENAMMTAFATEWNNWHQARQDEVNKPGTNSIKSRRLWDACRKLWHDLDVYERNL